MLDLLNNPAFVALKDLVTGLDTVNVVELFIIAIMILFFYLRFIKNSVSKKLFKGIGSILGVLILSKVLIMFNLQILGKFLEAVTTIILISLVVIFQPELRRFLGYLGQPGLLHKNLFNPEKEKESANFVEEIIEAVKYLSKSKTGALIVLQDTDSISNYSEVGTKLNAMISRELILTIFHPNTALHDGALIMNRHRILAAGVLLPLTDDPKLSWQYGTRHRAAIGVTEVTSATCVVVSEETGHVSITQHGALTKMETLDQLRETLEGIYGDTDKASKSKRFNIENLFKSN